MPDGCDPPVLEGQLDANVNNDTTTKNPGETQPDKTDEEKIEFINQGINKESPVTGGGSKIQDTSADDVLQAAQKYKDQQKQAAEEQTQEVSSSSDTSSADLDSSTSNASTASVSTSNNASNTTNEDTTDAVMQALMNAEEELEEELVEE